MIEDIQKYPVRFVQYAALFGSLYALAQGQFIIAMGLFAFALTIEKILAALCFGNGAASPYEIDFSFALSKDGFSYPSQAFGLFADTCKGGVKKIISCMQKPEVDVEAPVARM